MVRLSDVNYLRAGNMTPRVIDITGALLIFIVAHHETTMAALFATIPRNLSRRI